MRRFLVFLHYDPDGYVDEAVLHTLRGLRPHVARILVVVNGHLQAESRARLSAEVDEVFERENVGYDAGAYRSALGHIGYDALNEYDELLLVNYTFFGPVTDFDDLFARMERRPVDFWGMTDHVAVEPHPIIGKGVMPEHIQSYWIAFRRSLFASDDFRRYWANMRDALSYNDVVANFETELTKYFADRGYVWECAYPSKNYGALNVSMEVPLQLLNDGCPMFKRRIYFHDLADMDHRGVAGKDITDRAIELGFPRELIIDGIIRRASVRQLATGLGLLLVHESESGIAIGRVEVLDEALTVREGSFWVDWLKQGESPFDRSEFVAVTAPDIPSSQRNDGSQGRQDRALAAVVDHSSENMIAMSEDARLGLIVPLTEHRGTALLADGWRGRREEAVRLASYLRLQPPLDAHAPLAPFAGIAMYRGAAFADLPQRVARAGGWNALSAQFGGDDGLADLLDLLAADIARSAGFLTSQATTLSDLVSSQAMLAEKYSVVSSRFEHEKHAPMSGALARPGGVLRARFGSWVRSKSPAIAKVMLRGERLIRGAFLRIGKAASRIRSKLDGSK